LAIADHRQARTSAKDEVEKDFGIKVDLTPVELACVEVVPK